MSEVESQPVAGAPAAEPAPVAPEPPPSPEPAPPVPAAPTFTQDQVTSMIQEAVASVLQQQQASPPEPEPPAPAPAPAPAPEPSTSPPVMNTPPAAETPTPADPSMEQMTQLIAAELEKASRAWFVPEVQDNLRKFYNETYVPWQQKRDKKTRLEEMIEMSEISDLVSY